MFPAFDNIRSNLDGVIWPPVLSGASATLAALLLYFEESQWLPCDIIKRRQYEQLGVLANHADKHSPYFKQRLEQSGLSAQDIATPDGLKKLQLLTRADIQQAGEALYCREVPPSHMPIREIQTSGSTGQPVKTRQTPFTLLFVHANGMREHLWHGHDFMERAFLILGGDHRKYVRQKGWGNPVDLFFPSGDMMAIPTITDIRKQVEEIISFQPQHLQIYPNNLHAIVTLCQREGIAMNGIKHVWCHTETLSPEVRKNAAAFLGASIEDNYSCKETGTMALQCPQSGLYHVMSESVILEVLDENGNDCAEGQVGRIVATHLHNFATPLIRYVVGDYAQMGGICPCGRGLPTLNAVMGRWRNMIVKPGGIRHWPSIGLKNFSDFDLINQAQVIQHSLEEIEVRLVVKNGKLTKEQEEGLSKFYRNKLDYPFHFRFTYFDKCLPVAESGKLEDFISHVA